MNRQLFGFAGGILLLVAGAAQAAVYDNVYWIGGSGEWTGDVDPTPGIPGDLPEYATGHWSTNPSATLAQALPAKLALGRNDGIRVGEAVGGGGFDLDRVACVEFGCTTTTLAGGVQLGTDIYIGHAPGSAGAVVNYNPNRMFLTGDDGLDRFGDFRIQPNATFPGTPTLNIANGAKFVHQTTFGGDIDGMWSRWNGAELNLDGAGTVFSRTGDAANGFASGAFMFNSYHGYANSVQTVSITNGARFENQGQVWFGISGFDNGEESQPGVRVVVTINNGHMDMTGGDEYALDNDNFLNRADLSFIYDHTFDDEPGDPNTLLNNELYVINFTGPGTITVDGEIEDPIDELDGTYTQAELDADFGAGRGGIRIARARGTGVLSTRGGHTTHELQEYGPAGGIHNEEALIQASYQDMWNLGILRANGKSGLTGDNFNTFFATTNNPGDNNYTLTSLVAAAAPVIPGDYNRDGIVDQADYIVLRKGSLLADGNGSLHIDAVDELIWRQNFGRTTLGSGGGLGSIPEPGTMLLTLIGLASLSVFRKRELTPQLRRSILLTVGQSLKRQWHGVIAGAGIP